MDNQTKGRVIELRQQGLGYRQIARLLGANRNSVRDYCRKSGCEESPEEQAQKQGHREYTKGYLINGHNGRFEYINGYTKADGRITVRCLECGYEFEYVARALTRTDPTITCQRCKEREQAERGRQKQEETERRKRIRERIREQERWSRTVFNQQSFSICPECNALFYGRGTYCSKRCYARHNDKKHEIARRARIGKADNTISLIRLYRRDKGRCYLCGEPCDWSDNKTINGVFIAGNKYPSIDHVVPLAKGGAHTWENIKLAHRICNSRKGAKDIPLGSEN